MSKSIRAVPAILTDDPVALGKMVQITESFTDFAQFDVMDGQFVPSTSISCRDITALKPGLHWEVHLMVLHPESCLEDYRDAGAGKVVFHYESVKFPEMVIRRIKELGMQAGIAVNPETPSTAIVPYLGELDSVLFMSVHPGYYGAEFLPEVMDKVAAFRKAFPKMEIGVDGGVNEKTIPQIAATGVDVIYIGSAIFRQPDPADAFRRLSALAAASAE